VSQEGTLTSYEYLQRLVNQDITRRFKGTGADAFMGWKKDFGNWLLGLFEGYGYRPGAEPENVAVLSESQWHGLKRTELTFTSLDDLIVPATVLEPPIGKNKGAGIVCQHGHGDWGRLPIIGDRSTPEIAAELDRFQYDFGLNLALEGYTTIAIDLFGFGSRVESRRSHQGRDHCDMLGLFMALFGRNFVVQQVSDIQRAIGILADWPGVDAGRIGMAGLSQGGRMTMFTTALDERIKVAVVSGSHNTFKDRVGLQAGLCGAQVVPGIMPGADTPDILASIAPRPLQLQWGLQDSLIIWEPAKAGIAQIERCYHEAGHDDRFTVTKFDGGHMFDFQPALAWFDKWL
jgi:dienelactone hydrolase